VRRTPCVELDSAYVPAYMHSPSPAPPLHSPGPRPRRAGGCSQLRRLPPRLLPVLLDVQACVRHSGLLHFTAWQVLDLEGSNQGSCRHHQQQQHNRQQQRGSAGPPRGRRPHKCAKGRVPELAGHEGEYPSSHGVRRPL